MELFLGILAFLALAMLAWYILGYIEIEAGKIIIVLNAGGSFIRIKFGYLPGYSFNDPNDIPNYDTRYDDWDIIPTQDVEKNGVRVYRWGPPGYEEKTLEENELEYQQYLQKQKDDHANDPEFKVVDKFWYYHKDTRGLIEREYGFFFFGLPLLYKIARWKYTLRKIVPAQQVLQKFTNSEKDHDEYEDWKDSWLSQDKTNAQINQSVVQKQLPLFIDDATVITDAETGMSKPDGANEMISINTVHNGQIRIVNPLKVYTRALNITRSVNTVLAAAMRSFTASRSLDEIQALNHADPSSDYSKMIKELGGGWETHEKNFVRTNGTAKNFGYVITQEYYFISWSPANDDAADAINSRLKLYVSEQNIQIAENEGTARGRKVRAELDIKGQAEQDYLKKIRDVPVDPNIAVYSNAIGNLKGTYAPGNGGIQTVLGLNQAPQSNIEPPKNEPND